ncbi:hypothetical protein PsYK624_084400 [Phanerochaete sordida]|uniref:Uncharacterized protein n=1 Tax=Phanerochaete sordida TaxID=48140 RepID=A0A9P3GCC7_9APHY|nr:hypothetical protein PsYK624_084400 [Phanerochaete sordida]
MGATNSQQSDSTEEYVHAFNKWLDRWRGHLYEQAIFAMDLANHPPDRLATHVVFILVERTEPKPAERERWFKVVGAEVLSREERSTALLDFGVTQEQVDTLNRDSRGDHTIQINIIAGEHLRMLWCSFRDLSKYQDMDKAASASLADMWEQALIAKVASGKPGTQSDFGSGSA